MSAKHTQGPWAVATVGGRKHIYGKGNAHYRIAVVAHDPAGVGASENVKPEVAANARLIAAAPEMLSALCWALPMLTALRDHCVADALKSFDQGISDVRAAIAKAEGQ
jgi:hypothetical protein